MRFRDRADAGQQLAERLSHYPRENALVLALPRGGVPVGYEVAHALKIPMDVFVARKIGAPQQPEFGIGALAEGGVVYLDERSVALLHLSEEEIEAVIRRESQELARRVKLYRGDRPLPELRGKTVFLIDDGIATGGTVRAALRAIRQRGPERLILAAPVAAAQTLQSLAPEADDIVCPQSPWDLIAIGLWYQDFWQVSDAEVITLLDRARRESGAHAPGPTV